jgi:hypothetical protein
LCYKGAGKTSLLYPLFRLVELEKSLQPLMIDVDTGFPMDMGDEKEGKEGNKGRILVGGTDVSRVSLSRLRHGMAIIPQDPVLFTGE